MKFIKRILEEGRYILKVDPAAKTLFEAVTMYPVIRVMISHRMAHKLYLRDHKTMARWISQRARKKTGIEIHPGAKIGKFLFIDHGMGVVIGETAEIGDYVTIYHGVTLGGTGKDKEAKRHPTVKDHCLIGAGATILGPVVLGEGSKVGAGAVLMESLPAGATAVGIPARIIQD